jgi:hypothetical protein
MRAPESHADANVLRPQMIEIEPLLVERNQSVVAVEHAQALRQVAQRVLELPDGVAQFALRTVERLLASPVKRGRHDDDGGEKQGAEQIEFLPALVA